VPQWIIKGTDVQRTPHIDSTGRRCFDGFLLKDAFELIGHRAKCFISFIGFIGSIGCLFLGILANRIEDYPAASCGECARYCGSTPSVIKYLLWQKQINQLNKLNESNQLNALTIFEFVSET
jgi:hypothetical protein